MHEHRDATTAHVQRAVEGNSRSLDWVVERFQPLVAAHIRFRLGGATAKPSDIEDLAQDVWFVAMQKLKELRARDGHFGAVLVTFLASTSTFLCNNFLRKQIRRGAVTRPLIPDRLTDGEAELMALTTGVVTRVARSEVKERLDTALANLPETERNIVVLRLCEQQSLNSIARALDEPPHRVTAAYRQALAQLRRDLPSDAFDAIRSCTVRV